MEIKRKGRLKLYREEAEVEIARGQRSRERE